MKRLFVHVTHCLSPNHNATVTVQFGRILLRMVSVAVCLLILTGATSATVANDFTSSCYTVNNHNYCFYTNGSVMSWNEARQFCAGMNSTLPIIRDEDIDKVFQKFIVNDSYNVIQNKALWIGARASPVNNSVSWHWINGQQSGTNVTLFGVFISL